MEQHTIWHVQIKLVVQQTWENYTRGYNYEKIYYDIYKTRVVEDKQSIKV